MERIAIFNGLSIDFERIKCINQELSFIIIEYDKRTEYIRNPFTNEIEKHILSDVISKRFTRKSYANDFHISISAYWNNYLKSK